MDDQVAAKAAVRHRLGSPLSWSIVLGSVALVSLAPMFPRGLPSGQLDNAIIAAVIGGPCTAVGFVVSRRQRDNPLGSVALALDQL